MKLLLSPHNDDEVLWCAYTIMRERPTVCVVFDSYVQPSRGLGSCIAGRRRQETIDALVELTREEYCNAMIAGTEVEPDFLGFRDDDKFSMDGLASLTAALHGHYRNVEQLWAPAIEQDGHEQHNMVGAAADAAFPGLVTHYLTYTRKVDGKSRNGTEVLPRSGDDIARKLRALSCYRSQLQMDPRLGCWPHFVNDLREYVI